MMMENVYNGEDISSQSTHNSQIFVKFNTSLSKKTHKPFYEGWPQSKGSIKSQLWVLQVSTVKSGRCNALRTKADVSIKCKQGCPPIGPERGVQLIIIKASFYSIIVCNLPTMGGAASTPARASRIIAPKTDGITGKIHLYL